MLAERGPVIVREPAHTITRGHIAETGAPERQRIDERFTEDDLFRHL
jgi:hypothetical protein